MRRQLFQGTYGILLLLAMVGLYRTLNLENRYVPALLGWLVLIALGVIGLILNRRANVATVELGLGILATLYQRATSTVAAGVGGPAGESALVSMDWAASVYALLLLLALYAGWQETWRTVTAAARRG
jgi:hypothetical protein